MSLTTTRAGFTVATDNTSNADNIVLYDNNVTQLETELGTPVQGSLPVTGNFEGRIKAISYTPPAGFNVPTNLIADYIRATVSPNAQNWIPLGYSTLIKSSVGNTWNGSGPSTATVNAGGGEVFQSAPCDGEFVQLANQGGQAVWKFNCQVALDFSQMTAGTLGKIVGKFNIFVNPTPQDLSLGPVVQPNPSTPGVVRLSFPVWFGNDSVITHATNGQHVVYGELFWTTPAPQPSWPTSYAFGVSAYLSATSTNGPVGTKYDNVGLGSSSIQMETYRYF